MDYWILHEQGHFDLHEEIKIKMENKIISRCKGIVFDTNGSTETEIEKMLMKTHLNSFNQYTMKFH